MMNEFDKAEAICDQKTFELFPKYDFVRSDPGSIWDFSGQTQNIGAENKNFFLEVKNRETASTSFHDETCYLESEKLYALQLLGNCCDADLHYLNFFEDDVAYLFNLREISITDVKISIKSLPYKTKERTAYMDKLVVELPYNKGKKYVKMGAKWLRG